MKLPIPNFIKQWLIRRAQRTPYFDLVHEGQLYMERWWLRKPPGHGEHSSTYDKTKSGIGIRIHHTVRSDRGRDLHCHPWWNISIVLAGGYWEIMPISQSQPAILDAHCYRRIWRGPGSIVFRRAQHRHRLEIPQGDCAWSLFIMGPWIRDWGFWTRDGWVYWRKYIGVAPGQDENTKPVKADVRVTAEISPELKQVLGLPDDLRAGESMADWALRKQHEADPLARCHKVFRGPQCRYDGPAEHCNRTFECCRSLGNEIHFAGQRRKEGVQ
jgi:hypothetical protein